MFPGAEGFCLGLLQTVGFRRRPLAPCCAGASWVYAGRFVPCGEPTKAPGAAGLMGCGAGLLDTGLTAAPVCRKSSIIVAADESTISWGPSPTFGELVSWPLPGGQSPTWAPEPPPENAQKGGVCVCGSVSL